MRWWECVHGSARGRGAPEGRRSAARAAEIGGPGKRWGHTCNTVKGGKFLYVFGGYGHDNSQTNDVHVFDVVKKTWSKPLMKGTPPSPRDSHSCTTVGNRLFVFGGTDGSNPLKDLHVLDTSSNTWIVPAVSGEGPEAREGHSATLVDKRLFIFGGCGKSADTHQEQYFNDLYILDTEILIWERAMTSGTPPSPRDSHTCSTWNKKIIVLGGEDQSDCYLSDVYMLDAETLVWKQVNTSGQMLAPRAGHTTVALGSNLFVFGGFTDARNLYDDLHVLNVGSNTWSKVVTLNRGPSARFSVAGDCLDERRGIIVFIGGCNNRLEALDDMYYLHAMPGENGLAEPAIEKPSIRRVLNKGRENNLPAKEPEKINNVDILGGKSDSSHTVNLQGCSQAGNISGDSVSTVEVMFEATITDANQHGYTIETTINGKLLRGMLFSSTASSNQDGQTYPNKRRVGADIEGTKLNERQPLLNNFQIMSKDNERISATCAMESASKETPVEILSTGFTDTTTDGGLHQANTASTFMEPPLLFSSRVMKYGSEYMEPLKRPSGDMTKDSDILNASPAQDLQTETQVQEPSSMPSEDLKMDSEILISSPKPPENLKNVSGNLEPPSVPSDILKNDGFSDEPQKNGAEHPCDSLAADKEHCPHPQVKDLEQIILNEPKDQNESRME